MLWGNAERVEVDRRESAQMPERLRLDDSGDDEEHEEDTPVVAMAGSGLRDVSPLRRTAGARRHPLHLIIRYHPLKPTSS